MSETFDLNNAVDAAKFIVWLAEVADRARRNEKCQVKIGDDSVEVMASIKGDN